ncbi:Apoptosis-inducing factor 2 [Geranomyces variabilis]|uniref:Apoptosis-inducing factor 2 n=1 Tax=Geranomyces variabilis TaxID=109894 RepID=A0AAD5XPS5_9FUNG|nr:Apoptosis-inducing factor 2 [Geranomyces variabilis]
MPTSVLVVGGSYAGVAAAQAIESQLTKAKVDFTIAVVTEGDYFYHCIGGMRGAVEKGYGAKLFIPYDKLFKTPHGKVVHGRVVSLHAKEAILEDSTTIAFDYCVIATGSTNAGGKGPSKSRAQGTTDIARRAEAMSTANSILIVGGGPSAVELAGEIMTELKGKSVTVVHSGPDLCPGISAKFSAKLKAELEKLGVQIISNDRVERAAFGDDAIHEGTRTIVTSKGVAVTSDLQYFLAGNSKVNSECAESLGPDVLDAAKQVKTLPTLQLVGHPHIFAVGDVTDRPGGKLAYLAFAHGAIAGNNIRKLVAGDKGALQEYKPPASPAMIVTIGRNGGAAQLPFGVFGSWVSSTIKSKHLFLPKQYSTLNTVMS